MPVAPAAPPLPSVLAVDVGGTKVAAAVVGGDGAPRGRTEVATPASGDPEIVFSALELAVRSALDGAGGDAPVACGVGSGGPMSGLLAVGGEGRGRDVAVSPLNIPAWRAFPLARRLAEATGLATWVDNDAKALALGEWWFGAARGARDFLAMVVSTGVGGGLVVDGRLLDGADGNAGHIGHVVVEPGGAPCTCGGRGCLEAEASGTAIARLTGRPAAGAPADVVARTGTLVGRAVGSVCNLLDLRTALVAGSVALGFGAPFFDAAQAELDRVARLDFSRGAAIRPGGLGHDGPLVGAAAVAWWGLGCRP